MNHDLIAYIAGAILLLLAGFFLFCLIESKENEKFKNWNKQLKIDEERK